MINRFSEAFVIEALIVKSRRLVVSQFCDFPSCHLANHFADTEDTMADRLRVLTRSNPLLPPSSATNPHFLCLRNAYLAPLFQVHTS